MNYKTQYRVSIHKNAPEQSTIQKVRFNPFYNDFSVIDEAPLHDAYFYITTKYDIKKRLTKEFFKFCKGVYKIPTTYKQDFYINIHTKKYKNICIFVSGYVFKFCGAGFGIDKRHDKWYLTHLKSGTLLDVRKTKKEIEKNMIYYLNRLEECKEHTKEHIKRFESAKKTEIYWDEYGNYKNLIDEGGGVR